MKARKAWTGSLTLLLGLLFLVASGVNVDAADKEIVRYRLKGWKAAHFKDAKSADEQYKTLKKIGCEVKKHAHGDHIDVSYRCPMWRSIALKTHDEVHQWEKWLKTVGFETSHSH